MMGIVASMQDEPHSLLVISLHAALLCCTVL